MQEFYLIVYSIFCLIMSIYGIYFTAISIGAFLPKRRETSSPPLMRFAVLVPARNEADCIAGIVESIYNQNYPQEFVDVYVIPNHCTDHTAEAARLAGASVLSVSPSVRSKGQALQEAFAQLMNLGSYDAYCVFDADNEADPEFLREMNRVLSSGIRVAKSRILSKNAHESWVCACYEIYFCTLNQFLNTARHKLGLSARLIGTGFGIRHDLLEELGGWNTETLTEDAEFYATLSVRGEKIGFVPNAITYDEEPRSFYASLIQRRRWMSGILDVAQAKLPDLLHSTVHTARQWNAWDTLIQFTFAYAQSLSIPLFLLWACAAPDEAISNLPRIAFCFYICACFTGGMALLLEHRMTRYTLTALPLYPIFLFSFLPLQTLALVCPNRSWKPIRHTGVRLYRSKS